MLSLFKHKKFLSIFYLFLIIFISGCIQQKEEYFTTTTTTTTTTTQPTQLGFVDCSRFVWNNAGGGSGDASCENGIITINRVSNVKTMGNTAAGYGAYGYWVGEVYYLYPVAQIDPSKPYELKASFKITDVKDGEWLRFAFVILVRMPDNSGRYLEWDVWRGNTVSNEVLKYPDVVEVPGMQAEIDKWYDVTVPFSSLVNQYYGKPSNIIWSYFVIESTKAGGSAQIRRFDLHNL